MPRPKNPDRIAARARFMWAWNRQNKIEREARQVLAAGRDRSLVCELCGKSCLTVFDHAHATGKFRGWLCQPCNCAIGLVQEDVALLLKMADYIVQGGTGQNGTPHDILQSLDHLGKE